MKILTKNRDGENDNGNSDSNSGDVIQLGSHILRRTELGLDEEQVLCVVNELVCERDALLKHQEHLSSLSQFAERVVIEADSFSQQIRQKAAEEAKAAADYILANAMEEAKEIVTEKRAEAVTIAEREAETIKTNAQKQVELVLEENANTLRMVRQLRAELLSYIDNLKQQITTQGEAFERMLFQAGGQAHIESETATKEEESKETLGVGSDACPEVVHSVSSEALEQTQTIDQLDACELEKKAPSVEGKRAETDYKLWEDVEVLPPEDIGRMMDLTNHLETVPYIRCAEIVPALPNPLIRIFMGKSSPPLSELLRTLPEVEQVTEAPDGEATSSSGAQTEDKRNRIQIVLSKNPNI